VESKKNVTRLRSSSRSRSKSLSDHAAAPQLEAAPSNEEAGQNDKDDSDEGPTPQAKENEASKSGVNNENVVDESKSKPENESGVIQPEVGSDPISMKYAHLDLYWEKGGSMDLSSKEAKKALLKSSEIDKSNEKQVAGLPANASTFEFVLKGMRDYRSYLVRSRARNKSGWGEYCSPIEILTEKMEVDSKILRAGEKEILINWLPKKYQNRKLKMIFRASKKGFASNAFHAKCDNRAPTLTVVKAKSGNVFGGFTTVPWGMSNSYRMDKYAFIFLLRKKESRKKKKQEINKDGNVKCGERPRVEK